MGTFKTTKIVPGAADLAPVVHDLQAHFAAKGFEVTTDGGGSGIHRVSLAKGGTFKSVLGLKMALHIDLEPTAEGTTVTAGIGVFGQQAVPTALTLLVAWPVALAQLWGMVQQAKLDDEAVVVAEASILSHRKSTGMVFCTQCGTPVSEASRFCGRCGNPLPAQANP